MFAASKSSFSSRICLASLSALVLALALPGPAVRAQDGNQAGATTGNPGITAGPIGIDALDLEPRLRLGGDKKSSYFVNGTSFSLDPTGLEGFPGAGDAYPGESQSALPIARINGSMIAAQNSPGKGLILFAFRPGATELDPNPVQPAAGLESAASIAPGAPDSSASSVQPIIERVWAGLGGHHLVSMGSNGAFPVICRLRGGARPFQGSLQVSQNAGLVWSTPVTLDPGQEQTVEVDVGGSAVESGSESSGLDGDFRIGLRSNELGREVEAQPVGLGAADVRTFLITPSIAGHNTTDEAVCVAPDSKPLRNGQAIPMFTRLEAVSPALLPESEAGWNSAGNVILPRDLEHLLTPKMRSALIAWLTAGGHLVVFPGSSFIPSTAATGCVTQPATSHSQTAGDPTELSYRLGMGEIVVGPALFADLDHQPGASALQWAMNPIRGMGVYPNLQNAPSAPAPSINMPRWPVFLILGLLYAAILGPLSLWMMRRVRRIMHVWLVVPLTASLLTVVILALSGTWAHALRTLNLSSNLAITSGASDGVARSALWFFAPEGGDASLFTGGQMVVAGGDFPNITSEPGAPGVVTDTLVDGQHTVTIRNLPNYGERQLVLGGGFHMNGSLWMSIRPDGSGTLINETDKPLPPSLLTAMSLERVIPALAPGQQYHFPTAGWTKVVVKVSKEDEGVRTDDGGSTAGPSSPALASLPASAGSPGYPGAAGYPGATGYPGAAHYPVPRASLLTHPSSFILHPYKVLRRPSAPHNASPAFYPSAAKWVIADSPWGVIRSVRQAAGVRSCILTVTAPAREP
ncbi:MAG TPA: hypothetical protein VFJ58_10170 [Armatimonadota bacterium]|nr:hypothetical protein [Armatimonadota bacterium]